MGFATAACSGAVTTRCGWQSLLGQVQNRLRLNSLGVRANPGDRSPFKVLLGISIFTILLNVLFPSLMWANTDPYTRLPSEGSFAIELVYRVISIALGVFSINVILKTRLHIRERSRIPETRCCGCEDCCCALWCGCCAVAQMARHTADYETCAAKCCSETGLPVEAPQLQFGGTEIV
ncbi:hypothetical protein THAOC_32909 [Thalassiosira oceanica]|uniref:Uncharacterized protein n=1 Tax=Thalassiosira oceanica TaxID=159749 RepID=K0RNH8_THAOC|nr:hypothetical protein THAOC_32909 [Thalassiosira oceanica]|eukprot:EJK48307.1 hypothetical protein THAOC_32909 [Thalassiosira oceanica]